MIQNIPNIGELRSLLQSNEKRTAAFIGAGLSVEVGIDSWKNVLTKMAQKYSPKINIDKRRGEGVTYPQIAAEICKCIPYEDYRDYLAEQFKPKDLPFALIHTKVTAAFKIILTTNYDAGFEEAYKAHNQVNKLHNLPEIDYCKQKLPNFKFDEILLKPVIVYLHGNNDDKRYIFKQDEYESYYPANYGIKKHSILEKYLNDIFDNYNIVFIGFSFDDEDFNKCFQRSLVENKKKRQEQISTIEVVHHEKNIYDGKCPKYFAIIPRNEIEETVEKETVLSIFKNKVGWDKYFRNPSDDKLEFIDDIERKVVNIQFKGIRDDIEALLNDSKRAKIKATFLKENGIIPIPFEKGKYAQIYQLLEDILNPKAFAISDIKDASKT